MAVQRKGEERTALLRRKGLAQTLIESLEHNLELVRTTSLIEDRTRIDGNLNLSVLEATSSLKYEVMDDIVLSRDIDAIAWRLSYLQRQIEIRFEMEFSASFLEYSGRNRLRKELSSLIRSVADSTVRFELSKNVLGRLKEIAPQSWAKEGESAG